MSIRKIKHEQNILCDFSNQSLTSKIIKKSLQSASIYPSLQEKKSFFSESINIVDNVVVIGNYMLTITADNCKHYRRRRVGNVNSFSVEVNEKINNYYRIINIENDSRFYSLRNRQISFDNLIEFVYRCYRLNKLNAFS